MQFVLLAELDCLYSFSKDMYVQDLMSRTKDSKEG